jgi:6-phosphogluconolactonase/glucosamine-6-phosphate isomerase/deaminase
LGNYLNKSMQTFLKINNIDSHKEKGITIFTVLNQVEGIILAKKLLYSLVNQKTVLYLSGGSTPKMLYQQIAAEKKIVPGAVGMVDERFGKKWHEQSNEVMMQKTGVLSFFASQKIPFYPILSEEIFSFSGNSIERKRVASLYEKAVKQLHATFRKSIAILGVGVDGHTAGIAPNRKDFHNPLFDQSRSSLFVSEFNDPTSFYGERITMTFKALSLMDVLIVLVFGKEKRDAVASVFVDGAEKEIPARFYKRNDIAQKTLFITDQRRYNKA